MTAGFAIFLLVIFVGSLAGGLAPLYGEWSQSGLLIPVSFSGGVLLGATFFEMIPESSSLLHGSIGWPLLVGFLTIFVFERFVLIHPYPEGAEEHGHAHHLHMGAAAYAGLSFHSLLDGLAISSTYARPELAGVVFLAVIFHKIPDSFALTSLLLLDRWSKARIAIAMVLFALATPIGAIITWLLLPQSSDLLIGGAIALSAGTFLAVATSDVLPQLRRFQHMRVLPLVALFVGLGVSWLGRLIAG